jgi:Flp pilus assembly protein CpaB
VLLQRVLVLAIGLDTAARRSDDSASAVRASILTVSVNLQEAQLLGLAQSACQLMAVVRNSGDPRVIDAPPDVGRAELFDTNARQAVQRSRQKPVRLEREIQ